MGHLKRFKDMVSIISNTKMNVDTKAMAFDYGHVAPTTVVPKTNTAQLVPLPTLIEVLRIQLDKLEQVVLSLDPDDAVRWKLMGIMGDTTMVQQSLEDHL